MFGNDEYTCIALDAAKVLVDEQAADVAVYLPGQSGDSPLLYRQSGMDLSRPNFERLKRNGVSFLYIRNDDYRRCERVLEAKLAELLADPKLGATEKATLVQQVGTSIARDLTNGPVSSEGLARTSSVVDQVISCILSDPGVAAHILHMAGHERTTASHMFVVSALSTMLGAEIFGPDKRMLTDLGMAGMTHDIGKLAISTNVLNKCDALTAEELRVVQQHPIESVRLLGDDPHITVSIRQMILQHHERVDGRGYPLGIPRDELLPGALILSIVDSFHAMVGQRPYRQPVRPSEANRALAAQANKQFDGEFLAHWNALFERSLAQDGTSIRPAVGFEPHTGVTPWAVGEQHQGPSRHEHGPTPKREQFGPRPKRHACNEKVTIKCLYAGRLADATCVPDEFTASVRDVSTGGLCLRSTYPMYPGEVVHVQLDQGSHHIWVRGTVAWCKQYEPDAYHTGLRLVQRLFHDEARGQVDIDGISLPDGVRLDSASPAAPEGEDHLCPPQKRPVSEAPGEATDGDAFLALEAIATENPVSVESERTAVELSATPDPAVRRRAAEVLAKIRTNVTLGALIDLLGDPDDGVRAHAATMVGAFKIGEAAVALQRLLDDSTEEVALRAAGALGRLGDRSGLPLVVRILEREGLRPRLAACTFGEIVGHRFAANAAGVEAACRYLAAMKKTILPR